MIYFLKGDAKSLLLKLNRSCNLNLIKFKAKLTGLNRLLTRQRARKNFKSKLSRSQ